MKVTKKVSLHGRLREWKEEEPRRGEEAAEVVAPRRANGAQCLQQQGQRLCGLLEGTGTRDRRTSREALTTEEAVRPLGRDLCLQWRHRRPRWRL